MVVTAPDATFSPQDAQRLMQPHKRVAEVNKALIETSFLVKKWDKVKHGRDFKLVEGSALSSLPCVACGHQA